VDSHRARPWGAERGLGALRLGRDVANIPTGPGAATVAGAAGPAIAGADPARASGARRRRWPPARDGIGGGRLTGA